MKTQARQLAETIHNISARAARNGGYSVTINQALEAIQQSNIQLDAAKAGMRLAAMSLDKARLAEIDGDFRSIKLHIECKCDDLTLEELEKV